jgi:hypothetical protein
MISGYYRIGRPTTSDVKREFKKRHFIKDRSDRTIRLTFGYATSRGYLKEVIATEEDDIEFSVKRLEIKDSGWKLLNRSMFKILPKGLILAWTEENYKPSTLAITFISGTVIGFAGMILHYVV